MSAQESLKINVKLTSELQISEKKGRGQSWAWLGSTRSRQDFKIPDFKIQEGLLTKVQ